MSTRLAGKSINLAQPQPRALSDFLGREEGLEYPGEDILGMPVPVSVG